MANSVAGALWLQTGDDDPMPGIRLLADDGPMIRSLDDFAIPFGSVGVWQTL